MPKAFSEEEKKEIQSQMLSKGKELFERLGFKKTSVEDIAGKCGIAKGSFYLFYKTKEELFADIMGNLEDEIRGEIIRDIFSKPGQPKEILRKLLQYQFRVIEEKPLLKLLLDEGQIETIMRRLPEEKRKKLIKSDDDFISSVVGRWQQEGVFRNESPEVLSGFFRALFFLNLHKEGIGEEVYPEVIELFIDMVCESMIQEKDKNNDRS